MNARRNAMISKASFTARTASSRPWVIISKAVMPRSFQKKGWMLGHPEILQRGPVVFARPDNRGAA